MTSVSEISSDLQSLQRERAREIKTFNMIMNRLKATVAGMNGYSTKLTKLEREKMFADAGKLIKKINKGEAEPILFVSNMLLSTNAIEEQKKGYEKEMRKLAKQLPLASWVEKPEQRGFGILFLAIVIGETGDLSNYANPGKVWARLGCAPFTKNGVTRMGSTWRSRGSGKHGDKLHASDWEEFGYSPRRRSIAFLIGEGIVKQNWIVANGDRDCGTDGQTAESSQSFSEDEGRNGEAGGETERSIADSSQSECLDTAGDVGHETKNRFAGPYRERYDEAKKLAAEKHPEWLECGKCDGSGKQMKMHPQGKKCKNCKGTGIVWMHCHRHAMLLATKLLLKRLWIEWNQ